MSEPKHTTSLLEIRRFLTAHRAAPPAWETPEGVVARLYETLRDKQDDDRFWDELKLLVDRLDDLDFDRQAFNGVKTFRGATLPRLVDDLRVSLGGDGGPSSGWRAPAVSVKQWMARSVTVAALFSFLLLGVAIGCQDKKSSSDDDDNDTFYNSDDDDTYMPDCQEGIDAYMYGYQGEVFCDLVEIIKEADIDEETRSQLLDCLPSLDAGYRSQLLDMLLAMTEAQKVEYLTDPTDFCTNQTVDDDTWEDDDDH